MDNAPTGMGSEAVPLLPYMSEGLRPTRRSYNKDSQSVEAVNVPSYKRERKSAVARKTTIVLEDDLTGQVLESGHGETVAFALDGQNFEIDLSGDNAAQLRADLSRYVDAARKTSASRGGASGRRSGTRGSAASGRKDTGAIRTWARENGHEVSERGRVPSSVIEAYDAAH